MGTCAGIRKYKSADKEALRYICRETAGDYFRKSENMLNAVPLIYSDYFTENEPENIFVIADENDNAVGYILCSTDRKKFAGTMPEYMKKAVKADKGMFFCALGYYTAWKMCGKDRSVHLHIDILPEYQHMGLGSRLIDTLREYLGGIGIEKVGVNTIEKTAPAYGFYKKYGFKTAKHIFGGIYSLEISTGKEKQC